MASPTRTRLDEIVDSVWHGDAMPESHFNAWPECRHAAKTIAERAFRHGVEQADRLIPGGAARYYGGPDNVQPAPAEGKERFYNCCFERSHPHDFSKDRRHGQRRKGERRVRQEPSCTGRCRA